MTSPMFSICVPNYNYAQYVGETLRSALEQDFEDLEVCVADNASTDGSLNVIRAIDDDRLRWTVNACNVGFAPNLEKATNMARGERLLLLSSDDLMGREALTAYRAILHGLPQDVRDRSLLVARYRRIDAQGQEIDVPEATPWLWGDAPVDQEASQRCGHPVRRLSASECLRRGLVTARNPLPFLSCCYSRATWSALEGYVGARHINPDKLFGFRALAHCDTVYFVDAPLFSYRWHAGNQTAQQAQTATLKFLVDEYSSTFDLPPDVLESAGLTREDLVTAFLTHDVGLYYLRELARGNRGLARRASLFARATYPREAARNPYVLALRFAVALGPVGERAARVLEGPVHQWWRSRVRA